jgi:phospholipid-transporting ATPase
LVEVPRVPTEKPKSNYISTTKYNIITFLPLALLLQFKRYANIYFLFSAILQSIPTISPLSPASAIAPLAFVLALSMVREGFEDYKRWKSDKKDNAQLTMAYIGNQFE